MKKNAIFAILMMVFILQLIFARPGWAYIDPGSGSYFIQLLLGALLGGAFALRIYWKRIRSGLGKIFGAGDENEEDEDEGTQFVSRS